MLDETKQLDSHSRRWRKLRVVIPTLQPALQMVNIDQVPWSSADSHLHIQSLRTLPSVEKRFCSLLFFIFDWAGKYLKTHSALGAH